MQQFKRLLTLLPALLLAGCQHPAPAPPPMSATVPSGLHSPWDTTPIVATDAPYTCGPAAPIGPDITVSGALDSDKKYVSEDVKSAVYAESTHAVLDLVTRVVTAADTYRSTGSRAAATCVATLLGTAANNGAMTGYMSSDDAFAIRSHAYRAFAIAWLKVRGSNTATPQQTQAILQWLIAILHIERSHWEHYNCTPSTCYIKSHKGLSTAMASIAIGIAANNYGLYHWAIGEYHSAVGTINGRGMLHYDTKGRYAFKNNLRSAAALVQIAEFAETNNEPLYGYDNGAIHLLVHTVALGIVSPEPYRSATKDAQKAPRTAEPWEIAWASVYDRRFPDPVVTSLLQQAGASGVDMWGGEPWDGNPDPDPN